MINKLFGKNEQDAGMRIFGNSRAAFDLFLSDKRIAQLTCDDQRWFFMYSDLVKGEDTQFKPIVGFADLDKKYESDTLWPFFRIRIPGLSQPAVQEILDAEGISANDEVALLKRFGMHSISNPYVLKVVE